MHKKSSSIFSLNLIPLFLFIPSLPRRLFQLSWWSFHSYSYALPFSFASPSIWPSRRSPSLPRKMTHPTASYHTESLTHTMSYTHSFPSSPSYLSFHAHFWPPPLSFPLYYFLLLTLSPTPFLSLTLFLSPSSSRRAIERMPFIMVTPLIQVFGFCCFLVPCLFYGFNIASAGTFTVTYSYVTPFSSVFVWYLMVFDCYNVLLYISCMLHCYDTLI